MIAALALAAAALALPDPQQEARAQALDREIRCVVCENEPISESGADIAADMRAALRQQIAQGRTDAEIRDYFAARYGDFVLLRPRLDAGGAALWLAPVGLALLGGVLLWRARRGGGEIPETEENFVQDDEAR